MDNRTGEYVKNEYPHFKPPKNLDKNMDNDEIIMHLGFRPQYQKEIIKALNEARQDERAKIVERLKEEKKKLHPMCDDALDDIIQELESYNTPSK